MKREQQGHRVRKPKKREWELDFEFYIGDGLVRGEVLFYYLVKCIQHHKYKYTFRSIEKKIYKGIRFQGCIFCRITLQGGGGK